MRLTNARYINCKKRFSVRMIFGLLAVLFAGGSLLTGCRREREETGSSITGPFYVFGMDQDFRFGEVNYTYSSDGTIHERDELIGFIIREEDAETFAREDGYLYGVVGDFYVYDYDKNYLPVYSLAGIDYRERISVQADFMFYEYIGLEESEEITQ